MKCKHCPKEAGSGLRGLCWRCHRNVEIRTLYPVVTSKEKTRKVRETKAMGNSAMQTGPELDAMIAENISTMPLCKEPPKTKKTSGIRRMPGWGKP